MSEIFNLSWNDFQTNVLRSFSNLRKDTALCDVTLVTDDQKLVRAHRIVLSTCSEFFKNIFQNSQSNSHHLMLYLSDLSSQDLNTILDYIYLGEARIYQDGLENFLKLAQKLKLEGLQQSEDDQGLKLNEDTTMTTNNVICSNSPQANKSEVPTIAFYHPQTTQTVSKVSFNGNMDLKELEQKILELTEIDGDKCICRHCGKATTGRNRKQDLANHIHPCPRDG